EWFVRQLQANNAESAAVRDYLAKRQTSPAILTQFQLGFAPPGWENLSTHLRQQFDFVRREPQILMEAGLVNQRDNQQGYYDRFRNRLIIPIHDERGQVVAFGGRALSED